MAVQRTHPPTVRDPRRASDTRRSPRGASRGRRNGPRRGTHQKNTREQKLASCSGLGFTSVCTGSISPAVRAAGRRLLEARVRMLELRPPRRSARREPRRQAAASGNRAPARPDPASPGSSGRPLCAVAAASWSLGAACRVRAQGGRRLGTDRAQVTGGGSGNAEPGGEDARAWDPLQTLENF